MLDKPASKPDLKYRPSRQLLPTRTMHAGSQVIRIFDREKALTAGYNALTFNPHLVEDLPTMPGRYSARRSGLTCDRYSYLYLAEHLLDERVAFLECVNILALSRIDSGERILDYSMIKNLAFAYATCTRNLTLLDISNRPNADFFKANFEDLQGVDYHLTRRWGRYFKRLAPDIDGFYYCPVKFGNSSCGGNIILFAPHGSDGDHVQLSSIVPFDSQAGLARLLSLARSMNMLLMQ